MITLKERGGNPTLVFLDEGKPAKVFLPNFDFVLMCLYNMEFAT